MTNRTTPSFRRGASTVALGLLLGAQAYSVGFDSIGLPHITAATAEARGSDHERGRDREDRDDRSEREDHDDDDDRGDREDRDDRDRDDDRGRDSNRTSDDHGGQSGRDDRARDDDSRDQASRDARKDATGRTEDRPARGGTVAVRPNTRGGGVVAKLERYGDNIEITYTDGWKEEIENGRYELKDNLNRTVIERRASTSDRSRLFAATR